MVGVTFLEIFKIMNNYVLEVFLYIYKMFEFGLRVGN